LRVLTWGLAAGTTQSFRDLEPDTVGGADSF
jgi:hypothetical protein